MLVVTVLGVRVLHARSAGTPVPLPLSVASSPAKSATTPSATGASAAGAARTPGAGTTGAMATSELLVYVVGRVAHPGVVRVTAGARVQDAVAAAGGALRGADVTAINLARPVVDGEQVVVPRPGQVLPAAGSPAGTGSGSSVSGPGGGAAVLDLNAATETDLEALPGVGPVLAERIVAWRSEHGRFSTVDELSEVSGIGDRVLERLRPRVRV